MTRCRTGDPELSTLLAAGKVLVTPPAHARCWVLRDRMRSDLRIASTDEPQGLFWLPTGKRRRYRPYFENYTVDASIFEMILRDRFVIDDLKDH